MKKEVKQEVIIMHGLPASGKSTWARDMTNRDKRYKRLCRDDYREMLDNYSMDNKMERIITEMFLSDMKILLRSGYSVILDNTNLRPKYIRDYMRVVHEIDKDIPIRIKSFESVSYDEVIERDANRSRSVGVDVINRMALRLETNSARDLEKVLSEKDVFSFRRYTSDTTKPRAVIVDIDGTIAHRGDRSPYEWGRVGEDEPDEVIKDLLHTVIDRYRYCDEIIYVSGRDSVCRDETLFWLHKHDFPFGKLYMRPEKDRRKDSVIKYEIFDNHIRDNYHVLFVLDDRNSVVEMWRSIGLKCLQVEEGNF